MTDFENKIYQMKKDFCSKNNGENPTKVFIPRNKENEFILIKGYPIDKGVREYFSLIQGLEIIWDAKDFKVE